MKTKAIHLTMCFLFFYPLGRHPDGVPVLEERSRTSANVFVLLVFAPDNVLFDVLELLAFVGCLMIAAAQDWLVLRFRHNRYQHEGESCTILWEQGVCTPFSKCIRGSRFPVCSYSAQEAIVCCPQSQQIRTKNFPQRVPFESTNRDLGTRKSVQMCNEYKKLTTERVAIRPLTLYSELVNIDVPKCVTVAKLIVGGKVTKPGEFPHMAAIGWPKPTGGYSFDCGGSLISDLYVLTAAHCFYKSALPSIVRLGDQNLVRTDDGAEPEDYDILRFILYPQYRRSVGKYNDLALIQLRSRVVFTNFIRPACLYDSDFINVRTAIATGFGLVEGFGMKSDDLRKVALNIYDNALCAEQYTANRFVRQGIKDTQLCVGDLAGGKDTCQGDSGGPLQITHEENRCIFYIIGVTSFGKACGSSTPAIYTRVAPYLSWIESVVWP
ncbi:venom protease-like [Anopheles ziemanni]|uniref:venom protease-like n=1 Tax=Anopheles ziemanni TaxID=345580 RepID=UPI00265F124C|nr:venom protease-like [Anopheles ziemanni]